MLKPYSDYKSIKSDWMGNIPDHWDAQKIGELFTERKEKVSDKDYAPLSVSRGGIVPQISTVAKSNDGENRKLVRNGDFAINSRSDRRGSSGLSVYDGSVSLINIVLCPRSSLNGQYTHYLLKSHSFIEEYYRNGRGIVADLWTTRYAEMKSIVLPLPPLSEQDQIVRYLDWQVSKTNKLISALKKQIGLLKEQKQAVINEAVTKGLDPTVPMKDSGVDWIGKIPITWGVRRLKTVVKLSSDKRMWDNDFYIGMENIQSWTGKYIETIEAKPESICSTFRAGDILFGKLRPYLTKVFLTDCDGTSSSEFLTLRDYEGCTRYLYYLFLCYKLIQLINASTYGAKMPRANWSFIGNCVVPKPSEEEQKEVADFLDFQSARIDKLIENINVEIALLGEYRTRLICDVVIGQVDVRDIEVPEFEYIADEADDVSDDENIDAEDTVDEEE